MPKLNKIIRLFAFQGTIRRKFQPISVDCLLSPQDIVGTVRTALDSEQNIIASALSIWTNRDRCPCAKK